MLTIQDISDQVSRMSRKKEITGPQALVLHAILERLEALESARAPASQEQPPNTVKCPVCVTRNDWAVGAKV